MPQTVGTDRETENRRRKKNTANALKMKIEQMAKGRRKQQPAKSSNKVVNGETTTSTQSSAIKTEKFVDYWVCALCVSFFVWIEQMLRHLLTNSLTAQLHSVAEAIAGL